MPGWLKFACTRSNRWMRFRCESLELGRAAGSNSNRVWARYSADGRWVNGKSTPAIHQIDPDLFSSLAFLPMHTHQLEGQRDVRMLEQY